MTLRYLSVPAFIGCTPLALALALPMAAHAEGFLEDAKVNVMTRNYYFNRDFRNSSNTQQSKVEEWAQGFIMTATSGYTPGVVGFGLDLTGLYGIKLDSGRGRAGTQLLPVHDPSSPFTRYRSSDGTAPPKRHGLEGSFFGLIDAFFMASNKIVLLL